MKLPSDFGVEIAKALGLHIKEVEDLFSFEEDKQGYFIAKLKPKKFLDKPQFKALCEFVRTLNGEAYLQGAKAWRVPGPFIKKSSQPTQPSTRAAMSTPIKKSGFEVLPLAALVSMPFQSRSTAEDPSLEELAESIKETGVVEPIVVREKGGFYEIVMGERRVEASRKAHCGDIPAIVKVLSDEQAYDMQLIENIQRKDLSDMETAHALKWRIDTFDYTQEVLAKKLGKSQTWISQHLAMLQIPENIATAIKQGGITEHQAREILAAGPEQKEKIIDKINETGKVPSVSEMEKMKQKTVMCDHCGEPVENPVHLDGKFYHDECAEQVKAESASGLVPETPANFEPETVEPEKKPKQPEPEPLLTGYPWTCPCGTRFIIDHVELSSGKVEHRLEALPE